ncbi:MAG: TonB-dependent receptor, partial [Novosphingobium sp.]
MTRGNFTRTRTALGISVVLLSLTAGHGAFAQERPQTLPQGEDLAGASASASPADGGEIIVTAQGREQRLQDVPLSATVVSGASLQKDNIRDLQDLSSRIANVRIASAPATELLNIRGVGSGLNATFEQSVGTFIDGVYRGRSRSARAALFDVDRVEVLKGPQTTFFGNNAIAGALNITTRTPGRQFDYNASILRGSDGEYAYEAGVTVPIGGTLSARLAAKAYGMDGYIENDLTGGKGPHQRDWIGRIALAWRPGGDFRSDLRVDRGRSRDTDAYPSQIINCAPDTPTDNGLCARYIAQDGDAVDGTLDHHRAGIPSDYDYDFTEVAWRNELGLGGVTLKSVTSYFDHTVDANFNLFPLPLTGVAGTGLLFGVDSPESYRSFSQEIRLESANDGPLTYTLGAYFSHGRLHLGSTLGAYFAPLGAALTSVGYDATSPLTSNTDFHQKDTTWSAFGALTWHATERLRVNASLRYSAVAKDATRTVVSGVTDGSTLFPNLHTIIPGTVEQQTAINNLLSIDGAQYVDEIGRA